MRILFLFKKYFVFFLVIKCKKVSKKIIKNLELLKNCFIFDLSLGKRENPNNNC
ncbi:hypothetical protein AsAng_0058830 [Aureispira anguillae]|uniref:Uncharacterized protein n=1 Tax=Aureispira anguillae TaxID=2864201 RepID=A0A916DVF8_9BACT|nr:hypothetical protein AsAng_0058830 [Aureispira anguillae]